MSAVQHLAIVGRDAPLWLAACVMQSALGPSGLRVTAVELPAGVDAADGHAALPALEALHARLRIDEGRLLAATRGAFTLGKQFQDATGQAAPFFHAYGSTGARIDHLEFLPQWIRARRFGMPVAYEDFCLTAAAARHGRMLVPDPEIEKHGFTDYGYHLPAIPYGAWLKQLATRRGVTAHEACQVDVRLDARTGDIAGLLLDGGRQVDGDFFIDASGHEALLSTVIGAARESWRESFPASRLLTAYAPQIPSLPVYADVRAGESGWLALYPNQACTLVEYAFSSETPDDVALEQARHLSRMELQGARVRSREPARRVAWTRNCVAIGEAACVFDAIHGVDLQAVQLGLVHLLPLFPVSADFAVERAEYNQNVQSAFERIRDFQTAHYALNRYGGAFWARGRLSPVRADLLRKIGVFRARGEVVHYEDETFSIADWQSLLLGHGVLPDSWDPAVDRSAPEVVQGEFKRILAFIRQKIEWQRSHAEYVQLLCTPSLLARGERAPRNQTQ
ncbi:MAG TPA: tryptophan 7-halogenase [Steroidobacteraceae bacterium]|nr:tryptophan 7-halogenase [Steroidobacteraceae bacterium]